MDKVSALKTWIFATAMALSAVTFTPVAMASDFETIVNVSGEGRIETVPDMAVISLRIWRRADKAQAATADLAQATTDVLAALTAQGVEARDMQTSSLSLSPIWTNPRDGSERELVGYEASNMLSIRVLDLDRFGAVLDATLEQGANGFQGFALSVQEPRPFEDGARVAAFEDGLAKARLYAEAASMRIVGVRSITEGGGFRPQPMQEAMMMRAASADMPIAAGTMDIVVSVSLEVVLEPAEH